MVRLLISFLFVFSNVLNVLIIQFSIEKWYRKPLRTPVSDAMDFYPIPILFLFPLSPFLSLLPPSPNLGTDLYILGPLAVWLPVGFGQWEEMAGSQWPKERVVGVLFSYLVCAMALG